MTGYRSEWLRSLVHEANPRVVVLECSAIPDFEYTALTMLTRAEERLREQGISLWLTALNPAALKAVQRSPLGTTLGRDRMFFDLRGALRAYETQQEGARRG